MTETKKTREVITLTKLEIADRQLNEAITLFFEGRDCVSIHTLATASLQISLDHLTEDEVIDNSILLDRRSIYIKDECRREFLEHINKSRNFFKHADRDLKKGILSLEFKPDENEGCIFEAILSLSIASKRKEGSTEAKVFLAWLFSRHPTWVKEEYRAEMVCSRPVSVETALYTLNRLKKT